jgi:hypothetical protein
MTFWITGSIEPFDDTIKPKSKDIITSDPNTDTSGYDGLRQGVEIKTSKQLYQSMQPKIWGGYVDKFGKVIHEQPIVSLGNPVSFVEYYNSTKNPDLPKYSSYDYIVLGKKYPLPIWGNQGPQKQQEAAIEPLPIPFRLPSIDSINNSPRGVHGLYQETNLQIQPGAFTEVFYGPHYFLEQGIEFFGQTNTGSIVLEGYTSQYIQPSKQLFLETNLLLFFVSSSIKDNVGTLREAVLKMTSSIALNNSNETFGLNMKSSTAGWSYYESSITDSLVYGGMLRGS